MARVRLMLGLNRLHSFNYKFVSYKKINTLSTKKLFEIFPWFLVKCDTVMTSCFMLNTFKGYHYYIPKFCETALLIKLSQLYKIKYFDQIFDGI